MSILAQADEGIHGPEPEPFDPVKIYIEYKKARPSFFDGHHKDAAEFLCALLELVHSKSYTFGPRDRYLSYELSGGLEFALVQFVMPEEPEADLSESKLNAVFLDLAEAPTFLCFEMPRKYKATTDAAITKQLKVQMQMVFSGYDNPAEYQASGFVKHFRGDDRCGHYTATIFAQDSWWSYSDNSVHSLTEADIVSAPQPDLAIWLADF